QTGVFFFSSRRRHTRWPRDWSSDVCSSDLELMLLGAIAGAEMAMRDVGIPVTPGAGVAAAAEHYRGTAAPLAPRAAAGQSPDAQQAPGAKPSPAASPSRAAVRA